MGSIACLNTSEPSGFVFQYQIGVYGCDAAGCSAPGDVSVVSAARGDTIWLRHDIVLLQARDTAHTAFVRPTCARNVLVMFNAVSYDTVPTPTPTCADSIAAQRFTLGVFSTRFNQWVLDSSLTPRTYGVIGQVMVQPRIEPQFAFTIQ